MSVCERRFGDGVAHFPGRAIRNVTNRIDRLARWPGRDEKSHAIKLSWRREQKLGAKRDVIHFPKPANAFVAARKHSFFGSDKFNAAGFQYFHVF